jgi:hypothetical protein
MTARLRKDGQPPATVLFGQVRSAAVLLLVVLTAGGCRGASLHLKSTTDSRRQATAVHSEWEHNALHFPPRHLTKRPWLFTRSTDPRLASLARRYGFQLVSFRYLSHDEAVSLVVETKRPMQAFADDAGKLERAIDPVWHGGLSYHAFFFEARDSHGVPFIATQHSIVNAHGQLEGEQWARGPTLYPFAHL